MKPKFNNCIALGVADRRKAAERFVACFEAEITKEGGDWIEVTAGPYRLYFVEDQTDDIAFSVDVPKLSYGDTAKMLVENGFNLDQEISDRVGEHFVRDEDRILINLFPVD